MANVAHASLTGASLHEPKGVASAAANTVYAADGAGSGDWTDVNDLVTATNFTTGDCKLTFKTTADSSWVMMNDGTIGDALSSATTRANADCEDLFTLFWNNISNSWAAVSGGRGANAAADWAAHKTIALPKELGRSILIAGAGSGLTNRALGEIGGAETVVLDTTAIPSHTHTGTTNAETGTHTHAVIGTTGTENVSAHTHTYTAPSGSVSVAGPGGNVAVNTTTTGTTSAPSGSHDHNLAITSGVNSTSHTHAFTSGATGGGGAHANMQPWSAMNIMVKL
jgi:microcystin-dependent protein